MTAGEPVGDSLRALAEQTSCRLKVDRASRSRLTSLSLVAVTFALLDIELGILPRTVLIGLRPRRRWCSLRSALPSSFGRCHHLRRPSAPLGRSLPHSGRRTMARSITPRPSSLPLSLSPPLRVSLSCFPLPAIVLRRTSCPRRVSVDGHPTRRAFGVLSCRMVRGPASCRRQQAVIVTAKRSEAGGPSIAAEVGSVL
ncbi:hypothetical protein TBK1r_51690 [Stieleria magnilauensis]|uniref:Uncharacterized protein n=1 Tax=Stieleria magnilauensis TaxID=2527963 RepID=A0ABX5XXX7_9BACT|nr:hypothetical protein TBK1r_51690 [Planctomycetes bacterium TBK1r]